MEFVLISLLSIVLGGGVMFILLRRSKGGMAEPTRTLSESIVERVQSVGRLTGLEVSSKEITTQVKGGFKWIPKLVISPARLAVIFHFETHYYVDLGHLEVTDVRMVGPNQYEIVLPRIEHTFMLKELEAYDIQAGRLLGLLDITSLDAETHNDLMQRARTEAESMFQKQNERYSKQAERAVAQQMAALLQMFGVEVNVRWNGDPAMATISEAEPVVEPVG